VSDHLTPQQAFEAMRDGTEVLHRFGDRIKISDLFVLDDGTVMANFTSGNFSLTDLFPVPKTYEDGLAEGVRRGKEEGLRLFASGVAEARQAGIPEGRRLEREDVLAYIRSSPHPFGSLVYQILHGAHEGAAGEHVRPVESKPEHVTTVHLRGRLWEYRCRCGHACGGWTDGSAAEAAAARHVEEAEK